MKDLVVTHTNQKAEKYYQKWDAEHNDNKVWNKLEPVELNAFIGLLLNYFSTYRRCTLCINL